MEILDRMLDALDALARGIAIALATGILLILGAQIFFRYALNSSILWSEEVATWCLVWLVFIGSAVLMRRWEHVQIPMFIQWLPLRMRPGLIVFAKLATGVAVTLVAYYGLQWVLGPVHIRSQTSGISTRWSKLAVPVGAGLMTLFALRAALEDIRHWRGGDLEYFSRYGDLGLDEAVDTRPGLPTPTPDT